MSTSSTSELLVLADRINSARTIDDQLDVVLNFTSADLKTIADCLRLAATPKAGVDREVIARIISGVYGVGCGNFAGAHQDKSIERAADAILALLPSDALPPDNAGLVSGGGK